jgi:hypothetical protein
MSVAGEAAALGEQAPAVVRVARLFGEGHRGAVLADQVVGDLHRLRGLLQLGPDGL